MRELVFFSFCLIQVSKSISFDCMEILLINQKHLMTMKSRLAIKFPVYLQQFSLQGSIDAASDGIAISLAVDDKRGRQFICSCSLLPSRLPTWSIARPFTRHGDIGHHQNHVTYGNSRLLENLGCKRRVPIHEPLTSYIGIESVIDTLASKLATYQQQPA